MPPVLPLRFIPEVDSLHVYLNGVEQYETTDWVFDSGMNAIVANTAMEALAADLLECRYAHNSVVPPTVPPGAYVTVAGSGGNSTAHVDIAPHAAGDFLLVFVALNGTTIEPLPGFTYVAAVQHPITGGSSHIFSQVGSGSASTVTIDRNKDGAWWNSRCMVYTGGLTHVGAIAWSDSATAFTHTSPGVSWSGRTAYYCSASDPDTGVDPESGTGMVKRFEANSGNGHTHAVADRVGNSSPVVWTVSRISAAAMATMELR